jgi:putative addiction module component (TIGR02574 family)
MSDDAPRILKQALDLPAIDRAVIVESLLASLDQPDAQIDELWAEEAERRIAAYDAARMRAIPAGEVLGRLELA